MAEVEAEMRNWIRRWLDIEVIVTHIISNMKRLDTHSRHIEVLQIEVQELQRNLELARAAIRENTLPMEDRKAASDRIAEEAIKKMRGY